jgi:hypothetical protein
MDEYRRLEAVEARAMEAFDGYGKIEGPGR